MKLNMGTWVALGIGMGTAIGVALDNIGAGIAIGAGMGAALGAAFSDRSGPDDGD
jgi:zinc transporter ZupT